MAEFGETVHFKIPAAKLAKLDARWQCGIFLGRRDESAEVIIGTARGVDLSRSLMRKAEVDRWSREDYNSFIGVPWNPRGVELTAPAKSSRRKYIAKTLVDEHGLTEGCQACLGMSSIHSARCRQRSEKIFAQAEALPPPGPISATSATQAAKEPMPKTPARDEAEPPEPTAEGSEAQRRADRRWKRKSARPEEPGEVHECRG